MRRQHGVTIVEGLVALVILSVGMLGIASLYVTSLKTGRTALLRTQAVNLVNDMIDSIRANGAAGAAYALADRSRAPAPDSVAVDCEDDGVCTRDQIAAQDLMNWAEAVGKALPGADASIAHNPNDAAPDVYTVRVTWQESGEEQPYAYQASLEMIPVMP
jgi:type IV pilus assembly protein PilV